MVEDERLAVLDRGHRAARAFSAGHSPAYYVSGDRGARAHALSRPGRGSH